jgi:hypothetical protein
MLAEALLKADDLVKSGEMRRRSSQRRLGLDEQDLAKPDVKPDEMPNVVERHVVYSY